MLYSIVDNITDVGSMRFLLYNFDVCTRAILCKDPGSFVALAVNDSPLHEMPIFKTSFEPRAVIFDLNALTMKPATDPSPSLLLTGI